MKIFYKVGKKGPSRHKSLCKFGPRKNQLNSPGEGCFVINIEVSTKSKNTVLKYLQKSKTLKDYIKSLKNSVHLHKYNLANLEKIKLLHQDASKRGRIILKLLSKKINNFFSI